MSPLDRRTVIKLGSAVVGLVAGYRGRASAAPGQIAPATAPDLAASFLERPKTPGRYVALYQDYDPVSGYGVEVSGGGYARAHATFLPAKNAETANDADVVFPMNDGTGIWFVHGAAVMTAKQGGVALWHGPTRHPFILGAGDTFVIPRGDLRITMSPDMASAAMDALNRSIKEF